MIWIGIGNMLFWLVVFEYGIWRGKTTWSSPILGGYCLVTFLSTMMCLMIHFPKPANVTLFGL